MARTEVVVIGASAGGVEALREVVSRLPADLPVPVLVVLHLPARSPSALPAILSRSGPLPADRVEDGEPIRPGHIYVARSDHHLLLVDGRVRLSNGPAENGHRPAIDPLFRSAARAYGPGAVGVVLSGARDDGTAGLAAIAQRGGIAIVQDPADALHPSMPRSALEHIAVDHVLPAVAIGPQLAELVRKGRDEWTEPDSDPTDPLLTAETEMAGMKPMTTDQLPGRPSGFACPSCHGALFELDGLPIPRYRCRVGHAWSPESLLEEHAQAYEGALWSALRALEEKAALGRRMAASARERGSHIWAERYEGLGADAENAGALIRELIGWIGAASDDSVSPPKVAEAS